MRLQHEAGGPSRSLSIASALLLSETAARFGGIVTELKGGRASALKEPSALVEQRLAREVIQPVDEGVVMHVTFSCKRASAEKTSAEKGWFTPSRPSHSHARLSPAFDAPNPTTRGRGMAAAVRRFFASAAL